MTLIELIVGMVLLGIAGAMVFGVLIQGFTGSSGARAGGVSDAALARTTDAFRDDVSRAATTDSATGKVRDQLGLAEAVRLGIPAWKPATRSDGSVDVDAPMVLADIDDVRIATGATVQVVVGPRCITWRAAPARDAFEVSRSVAPSSNCNAATETRRYLSAKAGAPGFNRAPFSYQLMCNPRVCPPERSRPLANGAGTGRECRPWNVAEVPRNRLRWIVGIDARLVSLTTSGKAAGAGQASVSQSIRSREVERWREALGC